MLPGGEANSPPWVVCMGTSAVPLVGVGAAVAEGAAVAVRMIGGVAEWPLPDPAALAAWLAELAATPVRPTSVLRLFVNLRIVPPARVCTSYCITQAGRRPRRRLGIRRTTDPSLVGHF